MIINDFETIARNHARLFSSPSSAKATDTDQRDADSYAILEMSDEEVRDLLAAFRANFAAHRGLSPVDKIESLWPRFIVR